MSQDSVSALAKKAIQCRKCFEDGRLEPPTIDCAQPRWVGPKYWRSNPRVLALMINPGSGDGRGDGADQKMCESLRQFGQGVLGIEQIFSMQRRDMPNWGSGRFVEFFSVGPGLDLEELAFANVAWCATRSNKYPSYMLRNCFSSFTKPLIEILEPDLILLSGSAAHRYFDELKTAFPNTEVMNILHYAHREGSKASILEFRRVRERLALLRGT